MLPKQTIQEGGLGFRPQAGPDAGNEIAPEHPCAEPRPAALDWSIENCTVRRALAVLGDRWTVVVMREVFNGIRRFDDMRIRTSIPRQVLTGRLASLVSEGLLRREPYRAPGQRQRQEYKLTAKGLDLYPILVALNEWGSAYYADPKARRSRSGTVTAALRSAPRCAARPAIRSTTCVTFSLLPAPEHTG